MWPALRQDASDLEVLSPTLATGWSSGRRVQAKGKCSMYLEKGMEGSQAVAQEVPENEWDWDAS